MNGLGLPRSCAEWECPGDALRVLSALKRSSPIGCPATLGRSAKFFLHS
jgi:hypothetical protein